MKHDRSFRVLCICSGCDGDGKVPTADGRKVDCPDCLGLGEVLARALDDECDDECMDHQR